METWRPGGRSPGLGGAGSPSELLARRIAFNLRLPSRFPADRYDLVVGFDLDGFGLPPSGPGVGAGGPSRVVCLKGVAADELRFEAGSPRARLRIQALLEARAARRANGVVVPSRYSLRRAAALYRLDRERIGVVPEGLHLDEWEGWPERENGSGSRGAGAVPVVLSVARQYRRKNTADLLRAMPDLLSEHPGVRLRIVGGGPELPALRRLRTDLRLGDAVELLGELPSRRAVLREYGRAHLFCLPSLQEGFGIVLLEAMAAGLPVVACRAGAVPEVVEDGTVGRLVPPGQPRALTSALSSLLDDPDRRARMSRAARSQARCYGWTRVARIFLRRVTAREAREGV